MDVRRSILLADDHEVVRAGLKDALNRLEPDYQIMEAESVEKVLETLTGPEGSSIAICILDLVMPGMNGVEGIQHIRETAPEMPIAVMSGSARDSDVHDVMDAGALGFIPKTMKIAAMANAIRLIMSGERYLPVELAQSGDSAAAAAAASNLTPREIETLKAICKGLSNKEIARLLDIEEVTVKLHAGNIFKKLNTTNRTQAAMRARELGIV